MNIRMLVSMRSKLAEQSVATTPPPPSPGYERMSKEKWKQTLIDVPLVIGAAGLGYGLGRTALDHIGTNAAAKGKAVPGVAKYVPFGLQVGGALTAYGLGRMRGMLAERRNAAEAASKQAGVEPAPQAAGIPKKKPSDPWNYDPRPAYDLE